MEFAPLEFGVHASLSHFIRFTTSPVTASPATMTTSAGAIMIHHQTIREAEIVVIAHALEGEERREELILGEAKGPAGDVHHVKVGDYLVGIVIVIKEWYLIGIVVGEHLIGIVIVIREWYLIDIVIVIREHLIANVVVTPKC